MLQSSGSWLLGLLLLPAAALSQLPPPPPVPVSVAESLAATKASSDLREPLAPSACPTGGIPSFTSPTTGCNGSSCSTNYTWGAPAGADSATEYEILRTYFSPDYCASASGYVVVGRTTQRAYTLTGLGTNQVYGVYVRVTGCQSQSDYAIVGDTLQAPPAPATISATLVGQQARVVFSHADGRTFSVAVYRGRSGDSGLTPVDQGAFQNYCPAGSQKTLMDTLSASGTYTYYAFTFGNFGNGFSTIASASNSVTVCGTPSAPTLSSAPQVLFGGQGYNATWTVPSGLQPGSTYTVDASRSPVFSTLDSSVSVATNSTVIPLPVSTSDYDLYVRVKAVQPCGTSSLYSGALKLTVRAAPASFLITKAGPAWSAATTDPPPTATVSFRNVGSTRGSLQLSASGTSFFDVTPTALDLSAGQEGSVTLTARPTALATTGVKSGSLVASGGSAGTLSTPVTLTVVSKPTPAGSRSGSKVRANVTTVTFTSPEGNPSPQTIQLTLDRIVGSDPLYLSPSVGPGGAWLSLSNELSTPVPTSRTLSLTLSVDRSKQTSADGAPPYRTLLSITPVGGSADDAAVIEVVDQVPVPVGPGAGARGTSTAARGAEPLAVTPPASGSFIIPATVKGTGANESAFYTDGWLRNIGIGTVPVELYYTPAGKDGLADASVLKATTSVGPGVTLRLADLLGGLFRINGSGQVEVRSSAPGGLTLRTTVEAVTGGDPSLRFGTEIPTVSYGTGTGLNQGDLVLPGISDDSSNRCNLIVAETTGAAATVEVELFSPAGASLGKLSPPLAVPPYGQAQTNQIVKAIVPGLDLTGGWLAVRVTAGSGKIVPLATVIDNKSNSFSAVKGSLVTGAASREPAAAPESPEAALTYIVPAAVKAKGANDTLFTSSLRMVNGTASTATLTLTYQYDDLDAGVTKTATKSVTLGPRAALPESQGKDFLTTLLGVTSQSRGWVKMEGDVAKVTAVSAISTLVDPLDPGKGVKTAQVNGFLSDVPDIMALGQTERRFAGMEKSVSKRTNLILVETSGQAATVRLRAYSAAGQILAERSVDVSPNQYYQINDFFSDAGVKLGEGPFQNVEVAAQITAGAGRIVGIATLNDNISKNPEVFVLKDAGPPAPSIGF